MTEKRFELMSDDEVIIDNQSLVDDGGKETYWVIEYVQRKDLVDLLNELNDENKEYKQRVKETLQTFYNTTKQLKGEKLLIIGYLDLIKHIADELGVDLE